MKIYLQNIGLVSPLGNDVSSVFEKLKSGESGVSFTSQFGDSKEEYPLGFIRSIQEENRFEALLNEICSQIQNSNNVITSETHILVSSTKGELNHLPDNAFQNVEPIIRKHFGEKPSISIISNACVSGIMALNFASEYVKMGKYKSVFVIGIDALSSFVVNGFNSLFALAKEPTQPYDKNRKGINLGECGTCIRVSSEKNENFSVEYLSGASSNDANHISGPSRTGEGLFRAIEKTLKRGNLSAQSIDYISAHGTGTLYNDEMESIAFDRANLREIPMNSLKGYFGHTLGGAGVLETMIAIESMKENTLIPSAGFAEKGTTHELNIVESVESKPINFILKTGSGFGGGNAVLLFKRIEE